jgi:hypothetical protein
LIIILIIFFFIFLNIFSLLRILFH